MTSTGDLKEITLTTYFLENASLTTLESMLQVNVEHEEYEACALIKKCIDRIGLLQLIDELG